MMRNFMIGNWSKDPIHPIYVDLYGNVRYTGMKAIFLYEN